ncbi:biotin carboxylase [Sinobacterium caligoides]|uniref:Biotin carboxylase n=1 Tax=Sinobacterium caligoides TaxID=933926 RepID=A0A3N2E085_9GAMM|nr:ATP-grasp domain-containing protein [Sinobacterium caligoides]ROS05506.1 biotin carboxylase [Sinobacterium caligoides]
MKSELLLIGAGQWIIDWCEYYDVAYTLIQKPGIYVSGSAKQVVLIDYENDEGVWDYIEALCNKRNIVACLTSTEPALSLAAKVAEKFDLPYRTCENIEFIKDKWKMRQVLEQSPLNSVACELVESPRELQKFIDQHGTVIAKPQDGVGSLNVYKLTSDNLGKLDAIKGYPLLVERFIGGKEYSVEGFSYNGEHRVLGITEKQVDEKNLVEKRHVIPAPLPADQEQKIEQAISQFLTVIGIKNGPSHTELKVEDGQVYFIETHNRVAGDDIANLLELVSGFNLYRELVGWPIGRRADVQAGDSMKGCAVIDFIFAEQGRIDKICGVDSVRTMPGVMEVKIYKPVGSKITNTKSSYDRLGHIIAYSDSLAQCEEIIKSVHNRLTIDVSN